MITAGTSSQLLRYDNLADTIYTTPQIALLYKNFLLTFDKNIYLYHIFDKLDFTQKNTYEGVQWAPSYVFLSKTLFLIKL